MEEIDKNTYTKNETDRVIDILEILIKIHKNRYYIIKITVIFAILGLFVAILTPNKYTASSTLVLQTGQKNASGNLSGLAAMAGINLSSINTGEVLPPNIYPKIFSNINFQKEIIYSKFHFKGIPESITLYDYYLNRKIKNSGILYKIK